MATFLVNSWCKPSGPDDLFILSWSSLFWIPIFVSHKGTFDTMLFALLSCLLIYKLRRKIFFHIVAFYLSLVTNFSRSSFMGPVYSDLVIWLLIYFQKLWIFFLTSAMSLVIYFTCPDLTVAFLIALFVWNANGNPLDFFKDYFYKGLFLSLLILFALMFSHPGLTFDCLYLLPIGMYWWMPLFNMSLKYSHFSLLCGAHLSKIVSFEM